ncbi:hypothetical protein ACK9YZ_30495 [Rhizobium sp. ZK1]|uniref:hypothetical protein n=1 Tax=Rhizobium sp. ZK1 TaxID=3389872 RepID=UPI0039F70BC3
MTRYEERAKTAQYDTGFPIAEISIAMPALLLFSAVGHLHGEGSPRQPRVFLSDATQEGRAN